MKNYVSTGDLLDLLLKLYEKGPGNLLRKLDPNSVRRTHAAFNSGTASSNWWIIPEVKKRWNEKITGDPDRGYEDLIAEQLAGKKDLKLLSIGCGVGTHELRLAQTGLFSRVKGIDLAENLIAQANAKALAEGLGDICSFQSQNILQQPPEGKYDVVLFHSSLHHFDDIENFLSKVVIPLLSEEGVLILNEYVGPTRLQWNEEQLKAANAAMKTIPRELRKTRLPVYVRSKVRRPGLWRMILADPSEAIDSSSILSSVRKMFEPILEKEYGGNLLHLVLKDIAHNFSDVSHDQMQAATLHELFKLEDEFIRERESDFLFGIYRLRTGA